MAINSIGPTRLFGLASGLDTESLVKSLMRLEQMKLDRELRAKTTLQWRQDALNKVAADLKTFKNSFLTTLGADAMLSSNVYTAFKVELSGAMKEAVSVSANSEATAGRITVNKISQLAAGAQAQSAGRVSAGGVQLSESNQAALGDLDFANSLFGGGNDISFAINGQSFTFDKSTTLQQMLSTVNSSAAGVTMTYSRLSDGFTITTRESGAERKLTIQNISGNAFGAGGAFGIDEYTGAAALSGQNAVAYINGIRVERAANSFSIDGIQYRLNYVTIPESLTEAASGFLDAADPANDPAQAITVTLTKDTDSAYNKIKSFVDGYNAMIKKLNDLLGEKKDAKYYALTEEEKADMTEKQVEQWEGFAKSGLLRSDRDIQRLLDNMRAAFYSTVEGAGLSPQEIGLRTGTFIGNDGKIAIGEKGAITIDESTLRAALEKNSDAVMRVFMSGPDSANPAERGLLYRLSDAIDYYTKGAQSITLDGIERSMSRLSDKIAQMEKKMRKIEERYYTQYAALEKAMAEINSQTNWLNSMISGLTGGNS
jgi:flagellar hook-associated protein 2